jgi:hypothetical protein
MIDAGCTTFQIPPQRRWIVPIELNAFVACSPAEEPAETDELILPLALR